MISPHQVDKEFRRARLPRALLGAGKEQHVQGGKHGVDDEEPEQRFHQTHRRVCLILAEYLQQKDEQGQRWQHQVAHQRQG